MTDDSKARDGLSPTMHNLLRDVPDPNAKIVKLEQGENGRWQEIDSNGERRAATGSYDFVAQDGKILAVKEDDNYDWGHTEAAGGKPVTYAGRVRFTDAGEIQKWDNGSGHYLPNRNFARNAGLPMDNFEAHKGVRGIKVQLPVFQGKGERSRTRRS